MSNSYLETRKIPQSILLLGGLAFMLIFSGCLGTQYLNKGEYILYDQNIKGEKEIKSQELTPFFQQEANRKWPIIPFAPYVWLYQIGKQNYEPDSIRQEKEVLRASYEQKIEEAQEAGDEKEVERLREKRDKKLAKLDKKLEEGNIWMRWGEPLAVYDSSLTLRTKQQMESYLKTRGYFNGRVDFNVKYRGRGAIVNYRIHENRPYIIDTVRYESGDDTIDHLLRENIGYRLIKKGNIYNQERLNSERERIEDILRNNGYYNFSRQYVTFNIDSTLGDNKLAINTIVNNPSEDKKHERFTVDSVVFTTDANLQGINTSRDTTVYNGVVYKSYNNRFAKKILDRRLFIYPGQFYSNENTLETQRQLANLDIFKFININYDSTHNKFVALLYASPLEKYQSSNEVGINVTQGFPGPFYNLSFKNRNVFGGLEIMEVSGRAGIEGIPSFVNDKVYQNQEISGNLSLTFPQFILPLGKSIKSGFGKYNPRTRVQAGYNIVSNPDYKRETFNASMGYNWEVRNQAQYNLSIADLNYINSWDRSSQFVERLEKLEAAGFNLIRSFEPSFVSSITFQGTFNSRRYYQNKNAASYYNFYLESGGTSLNLLGGDFLLNNNLEYYKFFKVQNEFRRYFPLTANTTFAYRFNSGIALPYGDNLILPYEKYFFAGGSNSIRAWIPRRLGPGSYSPRRNGGEEYFTYTNEQQGEILFESSLELRGQLAGFLHGAFFIDAGNIWTLREDLSREGAQFRLDNFYREIAVGSGLGLRFDFSFLILRFDAAIKIYDPARPRGQRFIGQLFPVKKELKNFTPNIGIGYPF